VDEQRPVGDDHAGQRAISSARVEPELLHYLDVLAVDHRRRCRWAELDALQDRPVGPEPEPLFGHAPCGPGDLHGHRADPRPGEQGLDDKQINLGVVQPGERPAIFGDALRRLTNQAKFMHSDLGRYWYSMSASLNRLAADRAGQIEEPLVLMEIDKALATYINGLGDRGHFDTVQVAPSSSADVPDEAGGVRAVVLGVPIRTPGARAPMRWQRPRIS
jgi:uncharacterized protein